MLARVIERVAPQVETLVLSVEPMSDSVSSDSVSSELAGFGLPRLADPLPGHMGPLGGLLAAVRHFAGHARWLLVVPCDAPFLPLDLAARLQICAEGADAEAAVAVCDGALQPTFSLWNPGLLPVLEQMAGHGEQLGLKSVLHEVGAAHCVWVAADPVASIDGGVAACGEAADAPPPFFNVNNRADLERARRWLGAASAKAATC